MHALVTSAKFRPTSRHSGHLTACPRQSRQLLLLPGLLPRPALTSHPLSLWLCRSRNGSLVGITLSATLFVLPWPKLVSCLQQLWEKQYYLFIRVTTIPPLFLVAQKINFKLLDTNLGYNSTFLLRIISSENSGHKTNNNKTSYSSKPV